jgi:hypothetical protein
MSGTLCKRCGDFHQLESKISVMLCVLTGGFTNQAVSHSRSDHRLLINVSISTPAFLTSSSSSPVPLGERISLSIVIPQSDNAGKQSGRVDGEGGVVSDPVNPHSPSCATLGAMDGGRSVGIIGIRVQIRACSISGGTIAIEYSGHGGCSRMTAMSYLSMASHS